jgi:WD40 repeat protein
LSWLIIALFTLLDSCQLTSLRGSHAASTEEEKTLTLVAEYKKNMLEDISSDGRLLLFYQTSVPMRTYTITVDGTEVRANQPEKHDDLLRVVNRESEREVARTRVRFFPLEQQFVPDTRQVFYSEPKSSAQSGRLYKLWDITSGQTRVCLDAPEGGFFSVTFPDQQHALGTVSHKEGGESLGSVTLADCKRAIVGSVDPEYIRGKTWGQLALSPNRDLVAYTIYAGSEVIIRKISTRQVAKKLDPAPLSFGDKLSYTPDGKLLIVAATTSALGGENTKNYLLFYDTKDYQRVRRLEVPGATAMAISPDSRLLAVGYTEEWKKALGITEQAVVVLYDLATGQEVARASHLPVNQQRSDPFIARIGKLAFTPDGKYLLSSTYDTRIWQVEGRSH